MKFKFLIILVLLLAIAQGRRFKFLNHFDDETEKNETSEATGNENGEETQKDEGSHEDEGSNTNEGEGENDDGQGNSYSNSTCPTSSNETSHEPPAERETCQGVIFDAGSSGTRVFVYTWPCRIASSDNPEIEITQKAPSVKKSPGLSKQTVETLADYFKPLLDFANEHVAEDTRSRTPILLGATAGMRIIEFYQQYEIMAEVRKIFSESGYLFAYDDWARIISGKDEGAYLWLSVNYLKGFFNKENIDEEGRLRQSYATIDIGGASTQLAMEIKSGGDYYLYDEDRYQTDYHTFTANILNMDIYSHSWLYFGQDQAREQINKFLVNLHKRQKPIENPCYYSGQTIKLEDGTEFIGTGKPDDCKDLIDLYLIGFNQTCDQCAIQGSYIPQLNSTQQIFSQGSANFASKPFAQNNAFKISDFSFYDELCSKPFDSSNTETFYPTQCFLGLYVRELISVGYRVPDDHEIEIGNINGVEPSWTIAAMFDQIDKNYSCNDSPHCNFRKHLRKWRKIRQHPKMEEQLIESPFKKIML